MQGFEHLISERQGEKGKVQLDEITIMRPLLICFFLVGYHAFAPWGGAWQMPTAIKGEEVPAYFWIDKFLYSFMLETFVFISGYLFAFQKYHLGRNFTLKGIINNKFKRLIVPCVVFSILYSFISYKLTFELGQYIYDVLCGLGHLWFLPMLFWCFVLAFVLERIRGDYKIKLGSLFILAIIANGYGSVIPWRLGYSFYYLFFFYLAFGIFNHRGDLMRKFHKGQSLWILIILYVPAFIFFTLYTTSSPIESDTIFLRIVGGGISHVSSVVYSTLGLLSFYFIVIWFIQKGYKPTKLLVWLNPLCMGIYLIHNFILRIIYDKTEFPELFGTYGLPWISYMVALIGGIAITYILRKTTWGRALC